MSLSANGETVVLDAVLTGRFLSLHTGTPPTSEIGSSGTGYNRQAATFISAGGSDPTVYKNNSIIQFSPAVGDWGTVSYFGLWSAATGGNLIAYAPVNVAKQITSGDIVRWEINSIMVSTD